MTDQSVRVRSTTGMNTVIPALLIVLGALVLWRGASDSGVWVALVLAVALLALAWRLTRSGTAVVSADRLVLRGPLRAWAFPRGEVARLSVSGLDRPASLAHADVLVVEFSDGSARTMSDFAQSPYARGRDHCLEWLVGRVNPLL